MPIIEISVKNKVAMSPAEQIVCGNSDYRIKFAFDDEWAAHNVKTARFTYGGKYEDVIFEGDTCNAPVISGANLCAVGVYAGDLQTTTPALITCQKSILCGGGLPADPKPDVYAQIMEKLNNLDDSSSVKYTQQELDDEQKAQARANIGAIGADDIPEGGNVDLTDYVKKTDYATADQAGVVKVNNSSGIRINTGTGVLFLDNPKDTEINAKANIDAPLRIRHVDEIVRTGITTNTIELTDEEKQAAKAWLGIPESAEVTDEQISEAINAYLAENPIEVKAEIPIDTAEVGQTIVVKAVDENGKPTEWEAADLPSGGGGAEWKALTTITTTEEVSSITISTDDNGVSFADKNLTELTAHLTVPGNPELATKGRITVTFGWHVMYTSAAAIADVINTTQQYARVYVKATGDGAIMWLNKVEHVMTWGTGQLDCRQLKQLTFAAGPSGAIIPVGTIIKVYGR